MKITKEIVEHIAKLANLEFKQEEKEIFTKQLNSILEYMEVLNNLDTSHIGPYIPNVPKENLFREDNPRESLEKDKALKNSPEESSSYFKVPKVIT